MESDGKEERKTYTSQLPWLRIQRTDESQRQRGHGSVITIVPLKVYVGLRQE